MMLTEDLQILKYKIPANIPIVIDMQSLHHDKKQWREHERFIPDRFNPESQYYLTPDGQKRHPMSFGPFLGGKRICLGMTFAEIVTRVSAPLLIYYFDFEFENKEYYEQKPEYNLSLFRSPVVMCRISTANKPHF